MDAGQELGIRQRLGEQIGQLLRSIHLDQSHLTILDGLVREVLADVDVLGTLASADDVVPPFDARRVVLVLLSDKET